jgi:hypothetical protein
LNPGYLVVVRPVSHPFKGIQGGLVPDGDFVDVRDLASEFLQIVLHGQVTRGDIHPVARHRRMLAVLCGYPKLTAHS